MVQTDPAPSDPEDVVNNWFNLTDILRVCLVKYFLALSFLAMNRFCIILGLTLKVNLIYTFQGLAF